MEYGCKHKVIVITGGTSGIGLAAARAFWLDGASVCIVGRDSTRGMKALAEIVGCKDPDAIVFPGREEDACSVAEGLRPACGINTLPASGEDLARLRYIRADVAKQAGCRLAAAIAAHYGEGRIDILVNSAGVYQEQRLEHISAADYNRIMDVNVKGTIFMTQACQPYMLPQGDGPKQDCCVINIASDAGIGGNYGCPVYCASKGAVVALTRALALDLAPDIRVNCICPGDVDTPMLAKQVEAAGGSYTKEEIAAGYPLGRIASPAEIAHVICGVASPANAFMTGAVIPVDGGLTAMG
ncbi:MAG: SDR family oxidoreductase [Acidaminococcaceae bacterium]|nr:SDR family oxidoreductase [Acidaminococcaceae bacterium]